LASKPESPAPAGGALVLATLARVYLFEVLSGCAPTPQAPLLLRAYPWQEGLSIPRSRHSDSRYTDLFSHPAFVRSLAEHFTSKLNSFAALLKNEDREAVRAFSLWLNGYFAQVSGLPEAALPPDLHLEDIARITGLDLASLKG